MDILKPINVPVAQYILQRRYWLRARGVPKSKWKRRIVNEWVDSGTYKEYPENAFRETWDALMERGMI
jgi:hypothetical protein